MPPDSSDIDFGATIRAFAPQQRVFSRFLLKRILGRGGMGVVWLAEDDKLEREVALKFLPEAVALDPRSVDDLKRETRRSLELTHPHIVRIYDFFEDDTAAAISMEYVEGGTLGKLAVEQPLRCFEPVQILPWIRQLVDALEYAHNKAKIVHRDLKPANLMIADNGDLKITDFGISATVTDSMTRVSRLMSSGATPAYSSPQQVMGERASPSDDIYSLGASIFDLITGKPPFHSGNLLVQVQSKPPDSMKERREELGVQGGEIPESWERTVAACLQKDRESRPASPKAIIAALEGGELVLAGIEGAKQTSKKTAAVVAPVVVAVAAGGAGATVPPAGGGSTVPPAAPPADTGSERPPLDGVGGRIKRMVTGREGRGPQIAALAVPVALLLLIVLLLLRPSGEPEVAVNQPGGFGGPAFDMRSPAGQNPQQQPATGGQALPPQQQQQPPQAMAGGTGSGYALPQPSTPSAGGTASPAQQPVATYAGPSGGNVGIGQSPASTPASSQPATVTAPVSQKDATVRPAIVPPPMPAVGSVEITSNPAGASVISEGREIGRTPLELPSMRPGRVEFSIRKAGFEDAMVSGQVGENETIRLEANLTEIAKQAASNREIVVPEIGIKLRWVEPGEFLMGSPVAESGPDSDERPQTRVRFSKGFWIGETEVTQGQWQALMGNNPSRNRGSGDRAPVDNISWDDAVRFCAQLNARERAAARVPEGYAYQLPTEAQWEYAARAGTTGPYAGDLAQMGLTKGKATAARPVASMRPNAWGLFDMHGNVSEWTQSWYSPYPGGSVEDFQGGAFGKIRVFRGGGYNTSANTARSAYRGWVSGSGSSSGRGMRVVLAPTY